MKQILFYKGLSVEELTREELLEAVHSLFKELEKERNWNKKESELRDAFNRIEELCRRNPTS